MAIWLWHGTDTYSQRRDILGNSTATQMTVCREGTGTMHGIDIDNAQRRLAAAHFVHSWTITNTRFVAGLGTPTRPMRPLRRGFRPSRPPCLSPRHSFAVGLGYERGPADATRDSAKQGWTTWLQAFLRPHGTRAASCVRSGIWPQNLHGGSRRTLPLRTAPTRI